MTRAPPPSVVALAGPNGAGKSTAGPALLKGALRVTEFVNADVIAQGLSAFGPERVALTAGMVMLARMRDLAAKRVSFAFETTLAGRMHAPWLATRWRIYDNSAGPVPRLIASGRGTTVTSVKDKTIWARMTKEAGR